jgi:hypothetical protein
MKKRGNVHMFKFDEIKRVDMCLKGLFSVVAFICLTCPARCSDLIIENWPPEPNNLSGKEVIESVRILSIDEDSISKLATLSEAGSLGSATVYLNPSSIEELELFVNSTKHLSSAASIKSHLFVDWDAQDIDGTINILSSLSNITSLHISSNRKTGLTNKGLESICKLPRLRSLTIPPHTNTTSDGYKHMENLKSLEEVYMFDKIFLSATLAI